MQKFHQKIKCDDDHPIEWEKAQPVSSKALCLCSQKILLHQGYMTHYLETTRDCHLRIERLWQQYDEHVIRRSILLVDEKNYCHVIATIQIFLNKLPHALKIPLLNSKIPLGHLLRDAGIPPIVQQRRYFMMPSIFLNDPWVPYRLCFCGHFFGRFHVLTSSDGEILAEIYEALP